MMILPKLQVVDPTTTQLGGSWADHSSRGLQYFCCSRQIADGYSWIFHRDYLCLYSVFVLFVRKYRVKENNWRVIEPQYKSYVTLPSPADVLSIKACPCTAGDQKCPFIIFPSSRVYYISCYNVSRYSNNRAVQMEAREKFPLTVRIHKGTIRACTRRACIFVKPKLDTL